MILELYHHLDAVAVQHLTDDLTRRGLTATPVRTKSSFYIVAVGTITDDLRCLGRLPGVKDVFVIPEPYQLTSRLWRVAPTTINLGDGVTVGEADLALMMGPCSIENEHQVEQVVSFLQLHGVKIVRGGAFKPRSSPYSFRGLGIPGLKMLHRRAHEVGIKVISEVLEPAQIPDMAPFVDIFQVGTRNAQNFALLDELGKTRKPVLIKRGMSGTLEELLYAAEYVYSAGNEEIILCERGIRTFEPSYRNTFDINAIPYLKEKTHLPVIADPSHGVGIRRFIERIALASVVAGADGLLVEIHPEPDLSHSDAAQTLAFLQAEQLINKCRLLRGLQREERL